MKQLLLLMMMLLMLLLLLRCDAVVANFDVFGVVIVVGM